MSARPTESRMPRTVSRAISPSAARKLKWSSRASASARSYAAAIPMLRGWWMARMQGFSRESRSASSPVPSVLPSLMIRISYSVSTWEAAHTMSPTDRSRLSTSLNAGRNTLTRRATFISVGPREGGLHVGDARAERRARLQHVEAGLRDGRGIRMERVLERLRHRGRTVRRGDPPHRRLQVLPPLLGPDRRHLRRHSPEGPALIPHDQAPGLAKRRVDDLLRDRPGTAQGDDLAAPVVLEQDLGGAGGLVGHERDPHDGDVGAGADHPTLPEP